MAMLMMLILQWVFPAPKKPVDAGDADAAVAQLADSADGGQSPDGASDDDSSDQAQDGDDGTDSESIVRERINESILYPSDQEILDVVKGEVAESAEINAWLRQRSLTSVRQMGNLTTIGSLYESGTDRYLITLNPLGGTVRRIELNVRDARTGHYKYRDLIWKGGYIGSIEAHDTLEGVRVGVVGPGTPADLATSADSDGGIKAGDILLSLNGESITNAEEFGRMMAVTHPEDDITVKVKRGETEIDFSTTLTHKPIELVRPEPGVLDPTFVYDESFQLTLRVPTDDPRKPWTEIDADIRESQWEITKSDDNNVEMRFEVAPAALKKHGLKGPVAVVKRFGVPVLDEADVDSVSTRTWHWDFDFEIENGADTAQDIGYELKGPTGTPSETWWYSQKTHGRASALFSVAGARDVLGSTEYRNYQFWGCPEIVSEALDDNGQTQFFADPYEAVENPGASKVNWLGVDTLYFNITMFPDNGETFDVFSAFAEINGGYRNGQTVAPKIPKNTREHKAVDCTFRVFKAETIAAGNSVSQPFDIFSAPKDPDILEQYGLEQTRAFGWFWWCSKPLLWLMHLLYWLTLGITYTIPIIIITVLVRCLMIPFSRRAALNAQMMQYLQPQMKAIKEKFPDDMQKQAVAQQELFKKHNYKPLGGCLMGFIQLPVFLGLYRGLSLDIALRDQPLIPGLSWCSNLSGPDQLMYWKHLMPSWLGEAGWFGPYLNILPLATMVLFLVQQKMFTPPAVDEQQKMMQKMMSFMMLFMAIMFFKVPAGLCVYFVTSSIWAILEKKLLPKPELDTAKLEAADDKGPSLAEKSMALLGRNKTSSDDAAREKIEMRRKRNRKFKK
ncbi:Membrane protein insertase YidC [Mariniblastus fucicola]|uniref:Membrane protein insertase YidC n=2 Tax=Mariniblastus fucicola TaxID=980251 RepID=A0A5B9PIW1_9BACT|nr:Membrane protein insertase YidC [Mariniblastus fucicola]